MAVGKFKHHSHFEKDKSIQGYLLPFVCFDCRKSFKKPRSKVGRKCPDCGKLLKQLSRDFKPTAKDDVEGWKVVNFVVTAGFLYQKIYIDGGQTAKYPRDLRAARIFVEKYRDRVIGE